MNKEKVQYTDKELLDLLNDVDNLENVYYQMLHCDKWDIREAIASCIETSRENQS